MAYSYELQLIAVGTDDGCIYLYEWDIEAEKIQDSNLVFVKDLHKKRVMSIWFDDKRKIMFSIGEDKCLRSFNTANK
jgi:WD40 repeat protein